MKRLTLAMLTLCFAAPALAAPDLPDVSTLPANVVQVSPVVPMMGAHWADPATLPLGPIYCVDQGKIICLEYMISQEDFAAGKSWDNLAGRTDLPSIDHVSIGFEPHGHEGFPVPHYDLHIYFIPADQVALIK
ncbi:MAG: hypothetical protein ABI832_20255 [bacterium]